jgi:hypothetical protein
MTTNDYISSLHIEILHLNKNYFNKTNEENTTTDITNNGKIRSKSNTINDKKKIIIERNNVKRKILDEDVLDKTIDDQITKNETKLRLDAHGIPIDKNKKHKVTFIDKIHNKKPLVTIEKIESYKKYNILTNFHVNENLYRERCNCTCNII